MARQAKINEPNCSPCLFLACDVLQMLPKSSEMYRIQNPPDCYWVATGFLRQLVSFCCWRLKLVSLRTGKSAQKLHTQASGYPSKLLWEPAVLGSTPEGGIHKNLGYQWIHIHTYIHTLYMCVTLHININIYIHIFWFIHTDICIYDI